MYKLTININNIVKNKKKIKKKQTFTLSFINDVA